MADAVSMEESELSLLSDVEGDDVAVRRQCIVVHARGSYDRAYQNVGRVKAAFLQQLLGSSAAAVSGCVEFTEESLSRRDTEQCYEVWVLRPLSAEVEPLLVKDCGTLALPAVRSCELKQVELPIGARGAGDVTFEWTLLGGAGATRAAQLFPSAVAAGVGRFEGTALVGSFVIAAPEGVMVDQEPHRKAAEAVLVKGLARQVEAFGYKLEGVKLDDPTSSVHGHRLRLKALPGELGGAGGQGVLFNFAMRPGAPPRVGDGGAAGGIAPVAFESMVPWPVAPSVIVKDGKLKHVEITTVAASEVRVRTRGAKVERVSKGDRDFFLFCSSEVVAAEALPGFGPPLPVTAPGRPRASEEAMGAVDRMVAGSINRCALVCMSHDSSRYRYGVSCGVRSLYACWCVSAAPLYHATRSARYKPPGVDACHLLRSKLAKALYKLPAPPGGGDRRMAQREMADAVFRPGTPAGPPMQLLLRAACKASGGCGGRKWRCDEAAVYALGEQHMRRESAAAGFQGISVAPEAATAGWQTVGARETKRARERGPGRPSRRGGLGQGAGVHVPRLGEAHERACN